MRSKTPLDQAKAYEVVWDQVAPIFEATRVIQNPSFVYLIGEEDEGPVKIGTATNPIKRLRTMQTGNPRRLRVEWALVGHADLEKVLHRFWEPFAVKSSASRLKVDMAPGTEWFRSEVRDELFPIIKSAVQSQLAYLKDAKGDLMLEDFAERVIAAHQEHGFVFKQPDESRLLGQQGGYVTRITRGK